MNMQATETDITLDQHYHYIAGLIESNDIEAMTEDELWHFNRRFGLGGSDIGAILGLNPYKSAIDIWEEKTGRAEPEDLSENDRVLAGNLLEDSVAQFYTIRTGNKVRRANKQQIHPTKPWLVANLDRKVEGKRRVLECKTAGAFADGWGEAGTDEVPESYLAQVTHYMTVTGYDAADLAALIGGQDFRVYYFDLDHDLAEMINDQLERFWFECVIADEMPNPQNLFEANQRWRYEENEKIEATEEVEAAELTRQSCKAQIKTLEGLEKDAEFIVKEFMKDNLLLTRADGSNLCTWKAQTSNRLDPKKIRDKYPEAAADCSVVGHSRVMRVKK
jgi:putative phage-type endonuclease